MKPIAHIYTDFKEKFGIPRQSGLAETKGRIIFEPPFNNPDAVRGLEEFSHLWILWDFSEAHGKDGEWFPTVRPPKLGGNKRVGVFATRSPFRPNNIGLSCVKIKNIEIGEKGPVINVIGADILDGTPVYDIKPYVPYADCITDAIGGFSEEAASVDKVEFEAEIPDSMDEDNLREIKEILRQDPRPAYHNDSERIYGMKYGKYDVKFRGNKQKITVCNILIFEQL